MFKLLLTLILLQSCNTNNSPEGVLNSYIDFRFSTSQSKDEMLSYMTSPLLDSYTRMTDEEFKKFSNTAGHSKKKLKINYKNCSETECSITYTVKFEVKNQLAKVTLAEVKRAAKIVKVDDEWKISDITNEGSKTHFESKNAITPKDFKAQYNTESDNIQLDSSGNVQYDSDGKAKTK